MRTNLSLLRMLVLLISCMLTGLMMTGCVDRDTDFSNPDGGKTPSNSFTYSTTQNVQLDVQYKANFQVLFGIYTENPYVRDVDGQIVLRTDIDPIIMRMTDDKGHYSGKESIPSYIDGEVYIHTSYIGVPSLYKTTIQPTIKADINWDTWCDAIPESQTIRAGGNYEVLNGLDKLGGWDAKGRPDYLDNEGELSLADAFLGIINKTLPEAATCPENYRQSADFKVQDDQNRDVEVKVRFIGGTSAAASTFGYYCYKEGANKDQIQKAKKYIVFPNTKTGVGIKGGECVQLHYINEKGEDKGTDFPNGTMIGWFIVNDSFKNGNISNGYGTMYSTTVLNSDKRTHTAAFKINDFVVLSFEDYSDYDYNDVMFNVWANPKEALVTPPDIPTVDPGEDLNNDKSVSYKLNYKGILAFEDNWPSTGDYDLNDAVVKYKSTISFNSKNQAVSTEDTFIAMWAGAAYNNSFSYQLNTDRSNVECSLSKGMDKDLSLATIRVFANMTVESPKNETENGSEVKITNKFKEPIDHEQFGTAPYNPFISVFMQTVNERTEVHLVNHKPTDKVKWSLFGQGQDHSDIGKGIYYVSTESYPFAINLSDAESYSTQESSTVDTTYPRFASWVTSGGTKDKDWYLKK